jgi:hypothetical protein
MSWQTYVDEHLMCEIEGHHLTSAAIVGHDGAVWAQSTAFPQVIPICMILVRSSSCMRVDQIQINHAVSFHSAHIYASSSRQRR